MLSSKWNGKFFEKTNLTALGFVVELGHLDGSKCSHLTKRYDLVVFDLGGVHRLVVRYCQCGSMKTSIPKYTQLLCARWFPTTIDRPSMVFTFNLLDFFHTLQDRNKCNPYDFYNIIIQQTDAAGLDLEIVRFLLFYFFHHSPIFRSTVKMRSC